MNHIEHLHKLEREWHISVDSIVLDTRNRIGVAMQVMHDINKHTENSHVKTNLVHTLYRVQKYGVMELDKFNELLSSDEVKTCQLSTRKTWNTMPLEVFTSFIFKQEIVAATDNAVRKFNEDTAPDERSTKGVAAAMRSAIKEAIEKLYKKLSKIVAVANPTFGLEFLQEIERHWSLYSMPELTLDKLQMIATANVNSTFKVRWLRWINGSGPSQEARRFPARLVNEEKLLQFLAKAYWYAGEATTELFESIIRTDNIRIDMSVSFEPLTLLEYMEGWRMKLWDTAYTGVFKGADAFKKSDSFKEFRRALLAVKRLIYKYFKFELYNKKAIEKADLPPFLTTWLYRSSHDCMFSPTQLKNRTSSHLQACPWYLECNFGITPPEEEVLFWILKDTMVVKPEFDEFSGLDPEARARAIKKWEASDKRKVDKMEEAKKRTKDKKKKRRATLAEKEKEKVRKKRTKRKAETDLPEPATSVADMKTSSSGFSFTQECLLHGLSPTIQNIDPVPDIDECILNLSLEFFMSSGKNSTSKAFNDVLSLLAMRSLLQWCPQYRAGSGLDDCGCSGRSPCAYRIGSTWTHSKME